MKTLERERLRLSRKKRIKLKVQKQKARPRLSVFRSTKHIYAQIIDDNEGNIITTDKAIYDKINEKILKNENTKIILKEGYKLNSKNVSYDTLNKVLDSNEKSIFIDTDGNKIETSAFHYDIINHLFSSIGKIKVHDINKNKYFFKEIYVDTKKKEMVGSDISIVLDQQNFGVSEKSDPRFVANNVFVSKDHTKLSKGVFTICQKREGRCPPWSVKAKKIVHDRVKKNIYYKHAVLKIYDVPVFYFPKFFHPDPTVKRKSGFLMPKMGSSSGAGTSLQVPYYHVISDNKDITFSPNIYFDNNILLQNEYRQVNKNSNHISDFSVGKDNSATKSHLFSNTKIILESDLFDNSDIEFHIEKTSHDTYLKNKKITSTLNNSLSNLNSFVDFNASREDLSLYARAEVFEDLGKNKSDRYQYIYPDFSISKLINTETDIKGDLTFTALGSQKNYDTNIFESVLVNNFEYNSIPFFLKNGITNNLKFLLKNVNTKGKKSPTYKDDLDSENFAAFSFNSSLPLKKSGENTNSYFTPKASFRISPNKSSNLTDLDRRIDFNNIFSLNRVSGSDTIEGGQSLTLGSEYILKKKNDEEILSLNLATNFKDVNDSNLPTKSKLGNKTSDIVGKLTINPNKYINFDYDFSLDNNLETSNYNLAKSTITINNFVTSFEFLEENNELGNDSYLTNQIGYTFDKNHKLEFKTRKNKKTNLKEFYNLIYEYKNDCLVAAIEYNKDYYSDRDIKPNEELFFSLTIVPFATISSPNTKQ